MAEVLADDVELRPGMHVLDLGCGNASSSIFFAGEFGVTVWAVDLLLAPGPSWQRVEEAGLTDHVFPMRGDGRSLPFAPRFFDAIVSIDAYHYFGSDSRFLREIVVFLKPGGQLAIIGPGVREELDRAPDYFVDFWRTATFDTLHSPAWWRRLWERTELVDVDVADMVPDGWRDWLMWRQLLATHRNGASRYHNIDVEVLRADGGEQLGLVRVVARRRALERR
jgi:cyclopropane fatty-acyl-phospholipid synthase-like methyltransferase